MDSTLVFLSFEHVLCKLFKEFLKLEKLNIVNF